MPNNKNTIQTVVEFIVDKTSLSKTKKAFGDIEKEKNKLRDSSKEDIRATLKIGDAYDTMGEKGVKAFQSIGAEFKKIKKLDDDLEARLKARDNQFDDISKKVGLAGDFQSNLGAVQGLTGQVGLTGVSEGIGGIGEIGVLAEEMPRLKEAITGMPDVLRASANALGGKGVGLVGAFAALGVVMALATQEASRRAAIAKTLLDAQQEYFDIIQEGTTESINAEREKAQLVLQASQQELETRRNQREQINQELEATFTPFLDGFVQLGISAGITGGEVQALDGHIAELEQSVLDNDLAVQNFDKALTSSEVAINDAVQARLESDSDLIAQTNDVIEARRFELSAMDNSLKVNEDLIKSLNQENDLKLAAIEHLKAQNEGTQVALDMIDRLTEEYNKNADSMDFLTRTALPASQALEDEANAQEKLEENVKKAEQATKDYNKALGDQERFANQAISVIERFNDRQEAFNLRQGQASEDFATKRTQATEDQNRKLQDISRSGSEKLAKLNQDREGLQQEFFKEQIDSQRAFADELASVDAQRNLDRIQAERKGARTLSELADDNNVIGFLKEQRRQDEERQTDKENDSLEDKERAKQFGQQRKDQERAFMERRRALQRQVAEEQRQLRQRIQQQQQAFAIEQQRAQQAFQLSQQRAQQALNLERRKSQEQLQLILTKAQAEANAIRGTTLQVRALQLAVQQLKSAVSGFSQGSTRTPTRSRFGADILAQREANRIAANSIRRTGGGSFGDFNRLGVAFATGGIVNSPTLGLLGERRGFNEAIIPFRPSEGIRPALQRAGMATGGNSLTINAVVGENASVSEVKNLINQAVQQSEFKMVRGVSQGITQGRFNARAG